MGEIWSIDLESGEEAKIIYKDGVGFSSPQISPDGDKILFVGSTEITKNRNENLDIYVANTDGSGITQLTFHPGDDVSPIWSNDGHKIYFLSQRGNSTGNFGVWMIEYHQ
jgi:Tol biopolymer transport system component